MGLGECLGLGACLGEGAFLGAGAGACAFLLAAAMAAAASAVAFFWPATAAATALVAAAACCLAAAASAATAATSACLAAAAMAADCCARALPAAAEDGDEQACGVSAVSRFWLPGTGCLPLARMLPDSGPPVLARTASHQGHQTGWSRHNQPFSEHSWPETATCLPARHRPPPHCLTLELLHGEGPQRCQEVAQLLEQVGVCDDGGCDGRSLGDLVGGAVSGLVRALQVPTSGWRGSAWRRGWALRMGFSIAGRVVGCLPPAGRAQEAACPVQAQGWELRLTDSLMPTF